MVDTHRAQLESQRKKIVYFFVTLDIIQRKLGKKKTKCIYSDLECQKGCA